MRPMRMRRSAAALLPGLLPIALAVNRNHLAIHVRMADVRGNDFAHAHARREEHFEQGNFLDSAAGSSRIRCHLCAGRTEE